MNRSGSKLGKFHYPDLIPIYFDTQHTAFRPIAVFLIVLNLRRIYIADNSLIIPATGQPEHDRPGRGGGGEGDHPHLQRGGRDRGQQRQVPQGPGPGGREHSHLRRLPPELHPQGQGVRRYIFNAKVRLIVGKYLYVINCSPINERNSHPFLAVLEEYSRESDID